MNKDYKSKYNKLKRNIKNLLLVNASIGDEVCFLQAELASAREERMYLIERLMAHEGLERGGITQNNTGEGYKSKENVQTKKNASTKTISKKKSTPYSVVTSNVLVHSLGEIIAVNPNFHTSSWIYPVGYVATRIYAYPKDPRKKCVYTCKILNNAGIPQFQIIPDNEMDNVFFGETANICHQGVLKSIQRSLKTSVDFPINPQGETFFGLSNPKVQSLLKLDAAFSHCSNFKGFSASTISEEKNPTLSFDALQLLISNHPIATI